MTKRIDGLVAVVALVLALTGPAGAEEGRGWVFGGGVTSGRLGFANAEGRGVALGPIDGYLVVPNGGGRIKHRDLALVDPETPPPADAERSIPFPSSSNGMVMTMHGGYAFSPRFALLVDIEVIAPMTEGFGQIAGGVVVRYSPSSRLWIEAGPATGELGYSAGSSTAGDGEIRGEGALVAVGVNVVRKPKWTLGVQARYGRLWYDGFQTSSLSFGVAAGRVRSGKPQGGATAAVR